MKKDLLVLIVVGLVCFPLFSSAAEKKSVAVMGLQFSGKASKSQAEAMEDLIANEIRALGGLKVVSKNDIRGLLNLEKQKRLTGCTNDECLAEIGGALGVNWMAIGTISDFGKLTLLNLKVLDVEQMKVIASISKKVEGGQEQLVEVLPSLVHQLFIGLLGGRETAVSLEQLETRQARISWGHGFFWSGLGLGVLGGVCLGMSKVNGDEWNSSGDPSARDASKAWEGVMWASFGLSVALMSAGVVFWSWEFEKTDFQQGEKVSLYSVVGVGTIGIGGNW